jgi:putative ABC transport system permease protein
MLKDLRFALRTLARSPGYTMVALITLVLGISANATVFSLVRGVLLRPLPYAQADRLVRVREVSGRGHEMQVAWPNFRDWRESAIRFDRLAAYTPGGETTILGAGRPVRARVASVSEGFLATLRVAPRIGRPFAVEDHRLGAAPVVLVSDGFWRTYLGSDPAYARRPVTVDGLEATIIGVMPQGFAYPAGTDIWYPVELTQPSEYRTSHNFEVIGRLSAGTSVAQATAELDGITRRFTEEDPGVVGEEGYEDYFPQRTSVRTLQDAIVGNTRQPLLILLAASFLVLLIGCTNLASTALARGTAREGEYAIRHALGAGRGRMMRVIFTESLALSAIGGVVGLAIAWAILRGLVAVAPEGIARLEEVRLDPGVIGFTVALSLLAAALAGVLPGVRVSGHAIRSLRGGSRGGDDPRRQRIWKVLVGCEVALALLLLVGSGLLLRSFWSVLSVEPGYRTEGLLTATVDPPSSKYGDNETKRVLYDELGERLRAVPGVESVGLVTFAPMSRPSNGLVDVDEAPKPTASGEYQVVGAGYFEVLGIPVLRGRVFDGRDDAGTLPVVVVNEAFADLAWPGEDAVGKQMSGGGMDDHWQTRDRATVIGVVADTRNDDLTRPPVPTLYFSYRQRPYRAWAMTAVVQPRPGVSPNTLVAPIRDAVRAIDSDMPVQFQTIEQRLADALASRRFIMMIIMTFAACALVLAGVGVYGVVSYAVERRRQEIGIRMALGARPREVRSMVQGEFLVAAAIGAAAGAVLALALTRVMESLLFEVKPTDPLTFFAVVALLGLAGWLASFIPALRSTRIDPMQSMRSQ